MTTMTIPTQSLTYFRDTSTVARSRETLWSLVGKYHSVQTEITSFYNRSSHICEKIVSRSECRLHTSNHLSILYDSVETKYDSDGKIISCIILKYESCLIDGISVYEYDEMKDYYTKIRDIGLRQYDAKGRIVWMTREMYDDGKLIDRKIIDKGKIIENN